MYPRLFSVEPFFTLHTYGLFVAIGCLVGLVIAAKFGQREGFNKQLIIDMGFVTIISAIVGSRVMYVLMNVSYYLHRPIDIFKIWEGGVVFSGALLAALILIFWYAKRHHIPMLKIGDIFAPGVAIGQAIGRIGCFMAGCCYGRETHLAWGVTFTDPNCLAPINRPLHPTQIYSSISNFIIFLILMWLYPKKKFDGQVFFGFLILHSIARLVIENFRGDERGLLFGTSITITQATAVFILVASISLLLFLTKKKFSTYTGKGVKRSQSVKKK